MGYVLSGPPVSANGSGPGSALAYAWNLLRAHCFKMWGSGSRVFVLDVRLGSPAGISSLPPLPVLLLSPLQLPLEDGHHQKITGLVRFDEAGRAPRCMRLRG